MSTLLGANGQPNKLAINAERPLRLELSLSGRGVLLEGPFGLDASRLGSDRSGLGMLADRTGLQLRPQRPFGSAGSGP